MNHYTFTVPEENDVSYLYEQQDDCLDNFDDNDF